MTSLLTPCHKPPAKQTLLFYFSFTRFFIFFTLLILSLHVSAQHQPALSDLKMMSVEELMNVKVTLVTRTPENISNAASAIQVLSGEDIRRSGATNIPEALRLIPNIQVAQFNSNAYIVGVRGFNTIFANKLLVMIDGRTIYTPLFGGVIWDLQHVLLEDVDRIEVVSGPGGSLWGANAVNGVINIVTKKTSDTQGGYISAAAGNFIKNNFQVRYGGKLGKNSFYKVYGQHFDRKETNLADESKNTDAWGVTQAGFRMDFEPSIKDAFTIQGDFYDGLRKTPGSHSPLNGQNIMGTWSRSFSTSSDILLRVYYDRYFREDIPGTGSDELNTIDLDFQHRFSVKKRHVFVWGFGYRYVEDHAIFHTTNVAILPPRKNLDLVSGFIQDEISISQKLKLILGTKILNNVYTGIEIQPTARMSYSLKHNQTIWAAVSRAVRTPSRYDRDYYLPAYLVPPPGASVAGGPNFNSENLVAYEVGYRIQPATNATFSLSTFYNVYRDVYSVEPVAGTLTYQIMNGSEAEAWGFEVSGATQIMQRWKIRGGYTYYDKNIRAKEGHTFNPDYLGNDAKNRFVIQSIVDLPGNFQFDVTGRYTDKLNKTIATDSVSAYFTYDVRLAWVSKNLDISVAGQNLAKHYQKEFGVYTIPRSIYGKLTVRF
jgi:iron complex outermembrane receptor protein